ncbi:MAG: AAA family ATPase [Thermoplasmata archaeon]
MSIILVTGMPGCGKEEFIKVARDQGYDVVRMGDVVRDWAKKEGVKMNDKGVGGFAHSERERHHYGIWAERTLEHISKKDTVIDGVRGDREVEIFQKELGEDLVIVAVEASPETRFERLMERGREDAPRERREFMERDERELRWGLGEAIDMADVSIENEGTLKEFRKKVEKVLSRI